MLVAAAASLVVVGVDALEGEARAANDKPSPSAVSKVPCGDHCRWIIISHATVFFDDVEVELESESLPRLALLRPDDDVAQRLDGVMDDAVGVVPETRLLPRLSRVARPRVGAAPPNRRT